MKTYLGNAIKNQNLVNIILSLVLVLAVVFTVSCQSQTPASAPVPPTGGDTPLAPKTGEQEPMIPLQIEVTITASGFDPAILPPPPPSSLPPNAPAPGPNLPVDTTILWYNVDSVDHTVTARDNSFDSGRISPNETFKYTFEEPGEIEYYCKIHPSMVGKITIE